MLYLTYQTQSDMMAPVRAWATMALAAGGGQPPVGESNVLRNLSAAYELISRAGLTHTRPSFGITSVNVGNREVAVQEEAAVRTAFGTLLHFKKDLAAAQPRVLLMAPLSGHFATLLRATVRTMLPDHDVFITDWHNARDVPRPPAGLASTNMSTISSSSSKQSGRARTWWRSASPASPVLAAVASWREPSNPAQPRSHDPDGRTDRYPGQPDQGQRAGQSNAIDWFERNLIATVPVRYPRRVPPSLSGLRPAEPRS